MILDVNGDAFDTRFIKAISHDKGDEYFTITLTEDESFTYEFSSEENAIAAMKATIATWKWIYKEPK